MTAEKLKERLYNGMDVDSNGCHIWNKSLKCNGAPTLSIQGKGFYARRLVYELYHGPITKKGHVANTCRNPLCINPEHIFLKDPNDCKSVAERCIARCNIQPNGCWQWQGATRKKGYPITNVGTTTFLVNRFLYNNLKSESCDGKELKRTCKDTLCVNPDHFELGRSNNIHKNKKLEAHTPPSNMRERYPDSNPKKKVA